MDTPENIIEDEYNKSIEDDFDIFREKYIFSNIEDKYRMKVFEIDYDETIIDTIKQRVDSCRVYLNEIQSKL